MIIVFLQTSEMSQLTEFTEEDCMIEDEEMNKFLESQNDNNEGQIDLEEENEALDDQESLSAESSSKQIIHQKRILQIRKYNMSTFFNRINFNGILTAKDIQILLSKICEENALTTKIELDILKKQQSMIYLSTILCHTISFCAFVCNKKDIVKKRLFIKFKAQLMILKENQQLKNFHHLLLRYISELFIDGRHIALHKKLITYVKKLITYCNKTQFAVVNRETKCISRYQQNIKKLTQKKDIKLTENLSIKETENQFGKFQAMLQQINNKQSKGSIDKIKFIFSQEIQLLFTSCEIQCLLELISQWNKHSKETQTTFKQIITIYTMNATYIDYHILYCLFCALLFSIYSNKRHSLENGLLIDKYLHRFITSLNVHYFKVVQLQELLREYINNLFTQSNNQIIQKTNTKPLDINQTIKNNLQKKLLQFVTDLDKCKLYEIEYPRAPNKALTQRVFKNVIQPSKNIHIFTDTEEKLIHLYFSTTFTERYFAFKKNKKFISLLIFVLKTIKENKQGKKTSIVTRGYNLKAALVNYPPTPDVNQFLKNTLDEIFYFFDIQKTNNKKTDNQYKFVTQNNIKALLVKLHQYIDAVFCENFFKLYNIKKKSIEENLTKKALFIQRKLTPSEHSDDNSMQHEPENQLTLGKALEYDLFNE
jgi:hypothetical protein